jgi:hypothetical protein
MTKLIRLSLVALALMGMGTGCHLLQKKEEGGGGGGGGDNSQAMVDSMKSTETQYVLALPPGAAAGQWWEHSMSGTKMKYSIVAEKDGQLIVEQAMDMGGSTIINAWQVDPNVDVTQMPSEGEPMAANVTMAWVGAEGKAGEERPVMKAPIYKKGEGGAGAKAEEGDESVNLGGKDWDAHWTQTEHGKTWMAKGSTFILKSQDGSGKTTMELSGWGEDAKPALKW